MSIIQNQKRLHIVLKNQFSLTVIDDFIHHIDAVQSHTLIYMTGFQSSQADIIRLTETVKNITVSGDGVIIFYESGAELLIQRLHA